MGEAYGPSVMIVYAIADDILSPDFPLGVELEVFISARTPSGRRGGCEVTITGSRVC